MEKLYLNELEKFMLEPTEMNQLLGSGGASGDETQSQGKNDDCELDPVIVIKTDPIVT